MASKKPTLPGPKTDDLTRSILPGGARAEWWKPGELTPRQQRPISVLNAVLMPKYKAAMDATGKPQDELTPFDVGLSVEDTEMVFEVQELSAVTYLKSWTVKDAPTPKTRDDLLDLPLDLYNALIEHSARITASTVVDGFSPDGVEDPESPTGDSDV